MSFPYKSFFERHPWVGYSLLIISIIGIFFIPAFNRWLENKERNYNNTLDHTYKYLLLDRIFFNEIDRFVEWRFANSDIGDQIIVKFRDKHLANKFHQLIGHAINDEWNDGRISVFTEDFIVEDEAYEYEVSMTRYELDILLKKYFDMSRPQTDMVWNGLIHRQEDLRNSNKLKIVESFIDRVAYMSFPPNGSIFGGEYVVNKYHLKLVNVKRNLFSHLDDEEIMLECCFSELDETCGSVANYLCSHHYFREAPESSVFLDRTDGLRNLLLRFGISSEEDINLIINDVLGIKNAPEVRRTAYLLEQARRTDENSTGFGKLPDNICIEIAALTANDGVDLETARQVAASCLCMPKPYF